VSPAPFPDARTAMPRALRPLAALAVAGLAAAPLAAQSRTEPRATSPVAADALVPDLATLVGRTESELRPVVERYRADRDALGRRYDVPWGLERRARELDFHRTWKARLDAVDFDALGVEGRIDWILLNNTVDYQLRLLAREAEQAREMATFAPFLDRLTALPEARRRLETPEGRAVARTLAALADEVDALNTALAADPMGEAAGDSVAERRRRVVAHRTASALADLRRGAVREWYRFSADYDPELTWWWKAPYARLDSALSRYVRTIRERVVGERAGEDPPIIGDPIGVAGLQVDLGAEFVPYTPEELIAIAEREYAWCLEQMLAASRELGHGDDWKAALEQVKESFVPPGDQPALIRDMALEAIEYMAARDWLTVPPLATEVWRMEMMSPARQKVSPFFLGGEVILVSYPTDGMGHEDKRMSLRGNNPHFSRATVHHELIPGHHLQGYMTQRYNPHRSLFRTPFWGEGWALYWEFRLWDDGFPRNAMDRIGMLFWRMHRCARIVFSLGVHAGTMTPEEAVDYLVEKVGHERANAEAEVRRSFIGTYPPVYQAAYMLGALQFRSLQRELVQSGRMTERAFHDAILQGGRMPVELVRARLRGDLLPKDFTTSWRFYDTEPGTGTGGR
jgi:hypothetical protein